MSTVPGFGRGFSGLRVNPFPVRAALDIGTGGCITATVARVDASARAIREPLYHTSVPITIIEREPGSGVIDPQCWPAITNSVLMTLGALGKHKPIETAAVVTLNTEGSGNIVARWEREMRFRVHNLSRGWGPESLEPQGSSKVKFGSTSPFAACDDGDTTRLLDRVAFASAAAAAQCTAPDSLLVVRETLQGIEVLGIEQAHGSLGAEDATPPRGAVDKRIAKDHKRRFGDVLRCLLPVGSVEAHRTLVQDVQRRKLAGSHSSPNPCTSSEYFTLTKVLQHKMAPTIAPWIADIAALDGPIACYGPNGGAFNIAARVAGSTTFGLQNLDISAAHKFCGLTDVLLGESFPSPALVIPQASLVAALMALLESPRLTYLPDVAITHAMLVDDAFWTYDKHAELLKASPHQDGGDQRFFEPPRTERFDPTQAKRSTSNNDWTEPSFTEDERQWGRHGVHRYKPRST